MEIYFAGSIRGGREDVAFYEKIIRHLQKHGKVLTEHVGYAHLTERGEEEISYSQIHERDMGWLAKSDVVIAEITTQSTGVGYELGIAEKMNKKVLCLYREVENKRVPAMVFGNKQFTVAKYEKIEDAYKIIDDFIE